MLLNELRNLSFCNDCDKTFIFEQDVSYHERETGHSIAHIRLDDTATDLTFEH